MIKGPWFITNHAVERYIQRWRPGHTRSKALRELIEASNRAQPKGILESGAQLWRGPRPMRIQMIVSSGHDGLPQLVTVRPPFKGPRENRPGVA